MAVVEDRDRPKERTFNPSRIAVTDESQRLVAEVLEAIQSAEERQKARRPQDRAIHERAVSALVCGLAYQYIHEPEGWLVVEMSKSALAPNKRRAPFMTGRFPTLVKFLASPLVALMDIQLGDQQSIGGRRTTIRANSQLGTRIEELGLSYSDFSRDPLLRGVPLELRSAKRKQYVGGKTVFKADKLPLPNSPKVARLRVEMNEINGWIGAANISWYGDAFADQVDTSRRFLKRIFNNGSMEAGGRLNGGFWQDLPSSDRRDGLSIDDQNVVSLDFAQSALRMAYAEAGVESPLGDLYVVSGLESYRNEVKRVVNALLCDDAPRGRFPRGARGTLPKHWKFERVYRLIERHHAPIAHLFGSSRGLRYMYQESQILIRTLLELKSMGIVALPVHDCVLVTSSHGLTAKAVMEKAFKEVTGAPGIVEMEGSSTTICSGISLSDHLGATY